METGAVYDLAFSLGQACACTQTLRTARLQFASFPFDWISKGSLSDRVQLLIRRFEGWLEKEDFVYNGTNPINGLGMFMNRRTGLKHMHDFADGPIEASYAEVIAKYARREKRLFDLIEKSRRVLILYIDSFRGGGALAPSLEDFVKARADMSKAFPGVSFDFVHFIIERDLPFERRVVAHPAEGVIEIRFDYHDDVKDVCCDDTARALVSLGIKVRDYRTRAERKAHELKKKMKKYGVNTRLGLLFARLLPWNRKGKK